ncbi:MAG: DUF962 domain-containing protein [Acidobacteriia bacterium]|nr:DUF962 domain-containing protein [Terriglobia bacterium]
MSPSFMENYRAKHQHPLNRLTHYIGIPMIVASLVYLFFDWKIGMILFITGWIFQFVGHFIEGNQPAFFKNPIYLLVGPLFVLKKAGSALRNLLTPRPSP